jgi:SNF2 family DNA or RNA helicase
MMQTPWPSQTEAAEWAVKVAKGRAIIADEMGLGKTGEVYLSWRALDCPTPCIIIAGVNAQVAWIRQAHDWGVPAPIRIYGTAAQRRQLWINHGTNFVIITRESLRNDIASGWCNPTLYRCVISDEAHKDSNRKTKNFRQLKAFTRGAHYIFLATGSGMRKGPPGLWGLLNCITPSKYSSYWRFVEQYCIVDKEGIFGWEIIGTKDEQLFKSDMHNVMIARTKKDVRPQMPQKIRDLNSNVLQLQPAQLKLYNKIATDMMVALPTQGILTAQNVLTQLLRLRQILVTPKILDPDLEYGSAIERLIELLDDSSDQHMVVFSPFTAALPHIRSRLVQGGFDPRTIIQLSGGLSFTELMQRVTHFREVRGIALCSIRYAESFDLTPATWGVFLGYEWDAWDNLQAEDRLHRGEITDPINIYYLRHNGGVDSELMIPALDTKVNNAMSFLTDIDKVRKALQAAKG